MSANKYIQRTQEPEILEQAAKKEKKPASKGGNKVAQFLSGDFLAREFFVQNLGFIFFLMLLLLLLVAKGYYVKQLSDNISNTERELDDINTDYVELKARFLEETRRDKLVERLIDRGLKEPTAPPKVIRVKE